MDVRLDREGDAVAVRGPGDAADDTEVDPGRQLPLTATRGIHRPDGALWAAACREICADERDTAVLPRIGGIRQGSWHGGGEHEPECQEHAGGTSWGAPVRHAGSCILRAHRVRPTRPPAPSKDSGDTSLTDALRGIVPSLSS